MLLRGSSVGEGGGGGLVISGLPVAKHPRVAVVAEALPGLLASAILAAGIGHTVLTPGSSPSGQAPALSGLVAESGGRVAI